jgi:hypothetical protein
MRVVGLRTRPAFALFVDEIGSNRNKKYDGHVPGKLFILTTDDSDEASAEDTTDIHFTVLAFPSATGAVVIRLLSKVRKLLVNFPFL